MGDVIGYSGFFETPLLSKDYKTSHIEVFSTEAESFIKNPKKEGRDKPTQLRILKGAQFKQRDDKKVEPLERLDLEGAIFEVLDDSDSKYIKVKEKELIQIVRRDQLGAYKKNSSAYYLIKDFKILNPKFKNKLQKTDKLFYVKQLSGDLRKVSFKVSGGDQYWIERSKLVIKDKKAQTGRTASPVYKENPNWIKFKKGSTALKENILVDLEAKKLKQLKDREGKSWLEIEGKGWVKEEYSKSSKDGFKLEKLSAHDWIGFELIKETGSAKADPLIDYEKTSPFFKEIFKQIDANKDGKLSDAEVKKALKDPKIAKKLSRLICHYPSEWSVDSSMSQYKNLFKLIGTENEKRLRTQLKNLCWWPLVTEKLKEKKVEFPASPEVYHFHPIAFIEQMRKIENSNDIFIIIAKELNVEPEAIKAVAHVESRGDGFFSSGHPKILFEGHYFRKFTNGKYDNSHPTISHKYRDNNKVIRHYKKGEKEVERLNTAIGLDKNAALNSASWGKFQIMGFNYQKTGYNNVENFVKAMKENLDNHYFAFAKFIKSNSKLHKALKEKNWETFAYFYNGKDYKTNSYDKLMKKAYEKFKNN